MCQMLIHKYVSNFIARIERSNSIIIRNMLSYDIPFTSNIWRYWFTMIMPYDKQTCVSMIEKNALCIIMCIFM